MTQRKLPRCLRCHDEISGMGVQVFVSVRGYAMIQNVIGLFCINCGNSNNVVTPDEYDRLVQALQDSRCNCNEPHPIH